MMRRSSCTDTAAAGAAAAAAAAAKLLLPLLLLLGDYSGSIFTINNVSPYSTLAASAEQIYDISRKAGTVNRASAPEDTSMGNKNADAAKRQRKLALAHHPDPKLKWEIRLPDTGTVDSGKPGPRRHNAIQISPDDTLVYITLDDGTLHILDATNGTLTTTHTPQPVDLGAGVAASTACTSGVSFYTSDDKSFAIYAVVDVPPESSDFITSSRIIAVEHPSGQELWTSVSMEGSVSGTPQLGSDGQYIYLTRNIDMEDMVTGEQYQDGHFTLVNAASGEIAYTEPSSAHEGGNETGPYAPLTLVHNPFSGNFGDGEGNGNRNDVAVWAQSNKGGRELNGMSLAFQFPSDFVGDVTTIASSNPYLLKVNGWSTATKPTLSYDGQNLYFTASKASMRGWNTRFGRRASWKAEQLDKNGRAPLFSSATLSVDEQNLFVGSGGNSFYAIDAYSGTTVWRVESDSLFYTEARVSPDGSRVYSMEQANGKLIARNTETGDEFWSVSCGTYDTFNPFCQYNVDAEFSLSSDGYDLYYGDVFGTVRALEVGLDAPPTIPPTGAPTVTQTATPTKAPVVGATPSPTSVPTVTATGIPTVITEEPTLITVDPTLSPTIDTDEPTSRPTDPPTPEQTEEPPAPSTSAATSAKQQGFLTASAVWMLANLIIF